MLGLLVLCVVLCICVWGDWVCVMVVGMFVLGMWVIVSVYGNVMMD